MDPTTGIERFSYGIPTLLDGLSFVSVSVGLFALSEVFEMAEYAIKPPSYIDKISNLLPNKEDWKLAIMPILRGSAIGFFASVMPGAGATVASMLAYATEKKISKHPGSNSARDASKGSPLPRAPTTPPPAAPWSRSSCSASRGRARRPS